MNKKQALKILTSDESAYGKIDDIYILIFPEDIKNNLECNDYALDLTFIQDLTSIDDEGNYEMFQGHSLDEIELEE